MSYQKLRSLCKENGLSAVGRTPNLLNRLKTSEAEDFVESESSIPLEEVSLASEILEPPIPLKSVLSTFWCLLGACYGRSK